MRPAFRQRGIGKALLARLAKRCIDQGWARRMAVLDWNKPWDRRSSLDWRR